MVIPAVFFEELLTPVALVGEENINVKQAEYDGKNMAAIVVILDFLEQKLTNVSISFFCIQKTVFQYNM